MAGCGTMLPDSEFAATTGNGTQAAAGNGGTTGDNGGFQAGTGGTAGSTIPGSGGSTGSTIPGQSGGQTGGPTATTQPGQAGPVSGPNQASDTGVTATALKVGNITAVNGALGPETFTPLMRGAKLYFQYKNAQGGINGRKVDFQSCDDAESPNQNKQCAQQLIEGAGVFALVSSGTDTYAAASYINSKGVPDIGYPIGNAYYKYPSLFSTLGSEGIPRDGKSVGVNGKLYAQTAVYRHFKQKVGVTRAGVLYYSIAISATAGHFIEDGLKKEGIAVAYRPNGGSGVLPTQQSYDSDVIAMRQANVDGIWNAIDVAGFQKLCLSMDRNSFTVKANVSTVQGWAAKVGRDFSSPCKKTIYANSESAPYSVTGNPAVATVLNAKKQYDPGSLMHQWIIEGWGAAKTFDDATSSMGAAPTRKGFIAWMNAARNYTAGGIFHSIDWRPSQDFTKPAPDCFSLARWDETAKTFSNALGSANFSCFTTDFYAYVPGDDGS